jgi:hypothetical protein
MQRQGAAGQLLNIILAKLRGDSATENAPDVVEHKDAGGGDAHAGAVVSVLHAAEAMRGFYAKYGYVRIPVAMSVVQVPRPADDGGCGACTRCCTPSLAGCNGASVACAPVRLCACAPVHLLQADFAQRWMAFSCDDATIAATPTATV